ncbi:hypothetical protein GE09DRAFT_1290805 [Coniochaeta sp. 2T2.1]|nr:hypothetical protein GE09DRAFT_1290805 [Coniochaeta sp. 2T2.1]
MSGPILLSFLSSLTHTPSYTPQQHLQPQLHNLTLSTSPFLQTQPTNPQPLFFTSHRKWPVRHTPPRPPRARRGIPPPARKTSPSSTSISPSSTRG